MFKLIGDPLYQWNKWRKIEIIDNKVAFVDFASEGETVGTRVEVKTEEGVLVADIPNDKLWNNGKIKMWFVDAEKNAFASDVLVVLPKAKDPDYVYEPTEVLSYENLEARIKALEENGGGGSVDLSEIEADIKEIKESVSELSEDKADKENTYTKTEVDEIVQNLPSGGSGTNEKWELIVEHTVEQKANTILFTEDANGNSFNLKKLFVFVKIMANTEDESTTGAYLKINTDSTISKGDQNAVAHSFATCPKSTEEYCKAYVILEKVGDIVAITESRKSSNHTSVKDNLTNSHDYSNSMFLHKDEKGFHKKIDQINLISHSSRIGAGSTIVAYGIRESEV